ncbi:MAG: hypothetical protein QM790_10780 [Nibricoccus sp.]
MSAPKAESFKVTNTILIVLFVTLLWLPTIDSLFSIDHTARLNENRALATKPAFTGIVHTRDYLAGLETYFNDHFGFRKAFVRMQSKWKRKLFGEAAVSEAIIGSDGWIYTTANRMIESYTGVSRFKPSELVAWQKLLETRRAWLQQRGIAYFVVITPDKHTIYPEHLPDWLKAPPGPTKLDQWLEQFRIHSTLRPLDLRPILLVEKAKRPVYLMTDTHWNSLGAFISYQAVVRELGKQLPHLAPIPESSFQLQADANFKGDLAVLLGQESSFPERQAVQLIPSAELPKIQIEETIQHTGNKHVTITRTHNDKAAGKAIVFRDSFGTFWYQFFGYNFRDVIFLSQREFDPGLIEREKPDVVIDQIVERIVNTHDPVEMLERDGLR